MPARVHFVLKKHRPVTTVVVPPSWLHEVQVLCSCTSEWRTDATKNNPFHRSRTLCREETNIALRFHILR